MRDCSNLLMISVWATTPLMEFDIWEEMEKERRRSRGQGINVSLYSVKKKKGGLSERGLIGKR